MHDRLQRLRDTLRMEWGELATHLGLSRAMLDFVRNGQRNLSFKALRRLEQAEISAGISCAKNDTSVVFDTINHHSIKKVKISELESAIAEMRAGMDRLAEAVEALKRE